MRKACPYCKMMMVPVLRFSKNRREYLLKCGHCHYEEKSNLSAINNASKLVTMFLGGVNASVSTG